ncbi:hypothetical protein [Polaromonas sp. LjRoot131]|uniref:hypothetical protein n=1 Tax=Polaromonas sp. LjRoot131 TaxID=3342262 RepID=UPI003ED04A58
MAMNTYSDGLVLGKASWSDEHVAKVFGNFALNYLANHFDESDCPQQQGSDFSISAHAK